MTCYFTFCILFRCLVYRSWNSRSAEYIHPFATAIVSPGQSETLETMVIRASEERKKLVDKSCERTRAGCMVRNGSDVPKGETKGELSVV